MNEPIEASEAPAMAVAAQPGAAPESTPIETSSSHLQPPDPPAASQAEGADATEADDGEGADDPGDAAETAAADGQAGDPAKKKRRRRRRKKGGAQAGQAPGEQAGQEGTPQGERAERPHKEGAGGVFARFFEGAAGAKRHAFQAGEVVAGRVQSANEGAFAVDLFGKATAFVDIFEPHEVPVIPEAPEPAEAAATEGGAAPAEGSSAEVSSTATGEGAATAALPTTTNESQVAVEGAPVPAPEPAPSEAAAVPAEAAAVQVAEHEEGESEEAQLEEHHAEPEPEPEAPPAPGVGELFRGRIGAVAESGHVVLVNRIIDVPAAKARLEAARTNKRRVRGVVFGFNRGGFDVLVEGLRVFCPASGMALAPIEQPHEFLGQRLEFTVPPSKSGTHGFVVSRRGILERAQRKAAKALFRSLQAGQRVRGRVTQVREFGVFVDLGGIEGLVHQSELSFSRGIKPTDVAKIGDEIEVQVLRVGGEGPSRRDRERISLSIKALLDDPWSQHKELLEVGSVHTGKVVRTTDFGAFIEIAPMIEGLLHISELGKELNHANQAVSEGQEIRVVIERVDLKMRRISLSKLTAAEEKALEEAGPDKARPPRPGQQVVVVVDKIEHAGLIVQVPGVFGRRGRGFIPNSEMGTERGTDHRKGFPPGTKIPVKIIGADRDGGLRCSRKALLVEEEKRAVQDYRREAARHGLGTFGDLLRAKLEGPK